MSARAEWLVRYEFFATESVAERCPSQALIDTLMLAHERNLAEKDMLRRRLAEAQRQLAEMQESNAHWQSSQRTWHRCVREPGVKTHPAVLCSMCRPSDGVVRDFDAREALLAAEAERDEWQRKYGEAEADVDRLMEENEGLRTLLQAAEAKEKP